MKKLNVFKKGNSKAVDNTEISLDDETYSVDFSNRDSVEKLVDLLNNTRDNVYDIVEEADGNLAIFRKDQYRVESTYVFGKRLQYLGIINNPEQPMNYKNMSQMFSNRVNLTSLDLSNWDTSSVTDMSHMFEGCESLKSLDISNWDITKVTEAGHMFEGCESLKSLDLSNWDTASVIDMSYMFEGCESLESLDLSNWDTTQVTRMGHMFWGCRNLESLDLSNWDTSETVDMSCMFSNCSKLARLDLSNWNTTKVSRMSHMFSDCENLVLLKLSNWDITNAKYKTYMFENTPIQFKYPNLSEEEIVKELSTNLKENKNRETINLFEKNYLVDFTNADSMKMLSQELTTNRGVSYDVFRELWGNLTVFRVDQYSCFRDGLPDFDLSYIGDIETPEQPIHCTRLVSMFSHRDDLTMLDLSNWDTKNVTNVSKMFYNCKNLKVLKLNGWKIAKSAKTDGMFNGTPLKEMYPGLSDMELIVALGGSVY